jgi:hypothetical protein
MKGYWSSWFDYDCKTGYGIEWGLDSDEKEERDISRNDLSDGCDDDSDNKD